MDRDKRDLQMEISTKESIRIIGLMDLELIIGNRIQLLIKAALKMDWDMEKENGLLVRLSIQETTPKVWSKATENYTFQAVTFIKAILLKIRERVTVRCFGRMDLFIRVIGKLEFRMEKDKCI